MFVQTCVWVHPVLLLLFLQILWKEVDSQAFVEDRGCGILYSENEFQGNEFNLGDFDQSINLGKDFRVNNDGWRDTKSIRVEGNCTMSICSETYMQANCQSLPAGEHTASQVNLSIQSVNCTCSRSCRCADTFIPMNDYVCGRAYIGDGCNACDSSYLKLLCDGYHRFPSSYRNSIKSVVLRSGCTLEIFSEKDWKGTRREVKQRILENFSGSFGSYKFTCYDSMYIPLRKSGPPLIDDEIIDVISGNVSLVTHPGIKAALESFESGRSYKNAYIVLIGAASSKAIGITSNAVFHVGERRLQVRSDELGLNPQLGVINAWVEDDVDKNARLAATLDEYLSTHEDLKNSIPNAIVIWHYPFKDTTITSRTSSFQKKLAFVSALRGRLFDEKNSNLIVVSGNLHYTSIPTRRKPDEILAEYEDAIKSWEFPHPTTIVPFHWDEYRWLPNVNGYMKMENEEYWPMNLKAQLVLAAKRGGDPLGQAIFAAAYPEENEVSMIMHKNIDLLPKSNREVMRYRDILSNDVIPVSNCSEVTQKLEDQLFKQRFKLSQNVVLLKILKSQYSGNITSLLEIIVHAQSKLLDELKTKHESDISVKQSEINELRQELAIQKAEILSEWNVKTKEEFQKLRTELWESVKFELDKLCG